jgi:hypothetical protein
LTRGQWRASSAMQDSRSSDSATCCSWSPAASNVLPIALRGNYAGEDGLAEVAELDGFPRSSDDRRAHKFGNRHAAIAGGFFWISVRCLDRTRHLALSCSGRRCRSIPLAARIRFSNRARRPRPFHPEFAQSPAGPLRSSVVGRGVGRAVCFLERAFTDPRSRTGPQLSLFVDFEDSDGSTSVIWIRDQTTS